jgi:hypothetical protein
MYRQSLSALGLLLASVGLAVGQEIVVVNVPDSQPIAAPAQPLPAPGSLPAPSLIPGGNLINGNIWNGVGGYGGNGGGYGSANGLYGSLDYLLWWQRLAPIAAPLATTTTPGVPPGPGQVVGAINTPGTVVLSPGSISSNSPQSGVRLTVGLWVDNDTSYGVELGGFLFQTNAGSWNATSNLGAPPLFIPFFAQLGFNAPGGVAPFQAALPFSGPALNSIIAAVDNTRLWGLELNGVYNLSNDDGMSVVLLGGLRFLELSDNLTIQYSTLNPNTQAFGIMGDHFNTRNQFWGINFGARAEACFGQLDARVTGEIAVGYVHESVEADGLSRFLGNTIPTGFAAGQLIQYPAGVFAQGLQLGRRIQDPFAVVPQLGLQVGYNVSSNVRVYAGYDILYVSDVVRAGDQLDRRMALPTAGALGVNGIITVPPVAGFNHTDFWAQGFTFGASFKF